MKYPQTEAEIDSWLARSKRESRAALVLVIVLGILAVSSWWW